MATSVGTSDHQVLRLKFTDFRGQTAIRRVLILGTLNNAGIQAVCDALDAVTNAKVEAEVETVKPITGFKGAAVNALERNISEVMELAFDGVDTVTDKAVIRAFLIPAMAAAIEATSGAPDITNSSLAALVSALEAALIVKNADGTYTAADTTFNGDQSHHVTLADVVDMT